MTAKKSLRIRWRRIVTWIVVAYLLYWCGVSVHHMLAIRQQERTLNQSISAVHSQNHVLSEEIRTLHNPVTLKAILTGQAPLPAVDP